MITLRVIMKKNCTVEILGADLRFLLKIKMSNDQAKIDLRAHTNPKSFVHKPSESYSCALLTTPSKLDALFSPSPAP